MVDIEKKKEGKQMGLILVGSKLSTSKKDKVKKKEAKHEKTHRTNREIIPKDEVTVQGEEILNDNDALRDK